MENMSDVGLTLKKDDKKKDGGSGSFGKGAKSRLLGSSLGTKLFSKDFLSLEKRNSNSFIPKEQASNVGETMILYLLSRKANVNAKDSYGSTPLHYAVAKGNPDAVQELLTDPCIDIEVISKKDLLHCNYCNWDQLGRGNQSDYRKITVHSKKFSCGPISSS